MGNALLAPVIPDVLDDLGRPAGAAGLLVAATSLPGIVLAPVSGLFADRFGRRAVLVPSLVVFGAAGLAAVGAPSFRALLLARFVMGFGAAGLVNLAVTLISDEFDGEDRTRWIGINSSVLTGALACFPLVAGTLSAIGGWRLALAPYVLGIPAAGIVWRVLEPRNAAGRDSFSDQLRGVASALATRQAASTLFGGFAAFAVVFGVLLTALPSHLEARFGLGPTGRGIVLALPAVTSALAALSLGRLRHRFSPRALACGCALVALLAVLVLGAAGSVLFVVAGVLLFGAAEGPLVPLLQDDMLRNAPAEHRAALIAVWAGIARLGQTCGPVAVVLVLDSG